MLSLIYLVVRALFRGGRRGRYDGTKDLEILVLRHQLQVQRRTSGPPKLRMVDRVLLAAASRAIPRDRWIAFMVTPSDPFPLAPRAGEAQVDLPLDRSAGTAADRSRRP